mgnify:CR=1 FL=1
MAFKLANRAFVLTATTGTGSIALGSVVAGYQSFSAAGITNGDTVRYTIEDGTNWEIGTGTLSNSVGTMSRSVIDSSSGGSALTLSGNAKVFLTAAANDILVEVVEDTSPQLGGNLDVQAREITTSTSNGNVKITPNGSGVVEVKGAGGNDGTLQLNCSANTHGVKIKSPPHSASASYTLTLPNTDGSANQVLKTDGSGNLDWVAQTTDTNTTYSVGDGQLSQINFTSADHSKLDGITASANNYTHPNHSGEVTSSADGATVIAGDVVDEANLKVSNGPVDGYMLTAQSGATGGLTWAAQPSTSLPSLAGAGKVLTINSGNSAATWATPSGGGVSEDTVIALAIALG